MVYYAAAVPECLICGRRSTLKCASCNSQFFTPEYEIFFCDVCSERVHTKRERIDHKPSPAVTNNGLSELDLLSVICIETSHYVCFTRDLNTGSWIFFDSMADRECEYINVYIIVTITHLQMTHTTSLE